MHAVPATSPDNLISELRDSVRESRPDAFLVEARVVRRIIRERHGFARLSTSIPHADVLVAAADDVRRFAHTDELGLESFYNLPDLCILVAQPEDYELDRKPAEELRQLTWSRFFHGAIELTLLRHLSNGTLNRITIQDLIDRLGQVEFDEIHAVLRAEKRLIDRSSRLEAWCEFVAVYHQLQKFSPDLLPVWFPSLQQSSHVSELVSRHVDADTLFKQTQPKNARLPDLIPGVMKDEQRLAWERRGWAEGAAKKPSSRRYLKLLRRREWWNQEGNSVAAAVCAMRAADAAVSEEDLQAAREIAQQDIYVLADRLKAALSFSDDELDAWRQSVWELLRNSSRGFWNSDKRLLYDLQKVCLDHERTVYQVDLVKWIVSRGKRPLRRPLENLREVMMAKHLASCARRLVYVRLSGTERARLAALLHSAAQLAEEQMRDRMRSALGQTILDVGLCPESIPERVAFDKMVEESLDCIGERGYLTMGYLRDAISRNDLKLPDLTDPRDLIRGDHLLRTDDRLDETLDGVYQRGEFYLRGLQVLSSLFFGTRVGRFATLFIAVPFGGAVIIVVGIHHFVGVLTHSETHHDEAGVSTAEQIQQNTQAETEQPAQQQTEAATSAEPHDNGATETSTADADLGSDTESTANEKSTSVAPSTADTSTEESASPEESGRTENSVSETDAVAGAQPTSPADATDSEDSTTDLAGGESAVNANHAVALQSAAAQDEATGGETREIVAHEPHPLYTWIGDQTLPLTVLVGFLLMGLIHLPKFRNVCWNMVRSAWRLLKKAVYDLPRRLLQLKVVQQIWRSRWCTWLRRAVLTPFLVSWLFCSWLPPIFFADPQSWQMVIIVAVLLSLALNSRLGQDAEELAAEWLANRWHELRSRLLVALFEWVMDFFKFVLNAIERFIYAVDEWLRFRSGETKAMLAAKAVLGVIWSFISFLIRIYVNLLIEPTLHPVKHFPVVTVAHKIFLPFILDIQNAMLGVLTPYFGLALAGAITWFNILFLPGIFGFIVWELKENWRLYAANRVPWLTPVIIASHGEGGARLLKPGFYSGTLPNIFSKLRALERKEPSFHRFSERRAHRERLEHVERDIRRFVERDLIRLLNYCSVWQDAGLEVTNIHAASNSFLVEITTASSPDRPVALLFQEQSGWVVANVADVGFLQDSPPEQAHSFESALLGFYAKAEVELVREQIERHLTGPHPYDISWEGLLIWPERQFDRQIVCDLRRRHQIRPWPPGLAASYGIQPVSRDLVVFAESRVYWEEWKQIWESSANADGRATLPLACYQSANAALLPHLHR